jgi:oxygen-independent coproporphyrinogen-3 oxidase
LTDAIALAPDHLSLYALSLALAPDEWAAAPRPGAANWRRRMSDGLDDSRAADQYRLAEELLDAAGYGHYELSSWARPGRESRHNSAYWARRPYTGLGAGAHSFDGMSRSWNLRDLDRYLSAVAAGQPPVEGSEPLDEPTRAFESIALGLRRVSGLSRDAFAAEFGARPETRFADAVSEGSHAGLIEVVGDALRLTAEGRLLASEALVGFLPAGAPRAG